MDFLCVCGDTLGGGDTCVSAGGDPLRVFPGDFTSSRYASICPRTTHVSPPRGQPRGRAEGVTREARGARRRARVSGEGGPPRLRIPHPSAPFL